ncbi:type I site-specific deoxyribonuclease, HsdR family [Rippkaea orientalis PCC 8801]|uniref:Type I restriction enzyme endonuclease subunit n=1 Tax=Rippkaea orientalis (strain PCC 8801 / RF-1) TaxID=41431 RepID=B7K151_RIPO1|nr:HsdR family type I site-specific deoxyribonuclease [Rippkaea orientalis]ACK66246.1 type I site-specific deoxyribonuclease, HsdR family [Rippkaea orientalis PCC 8801]
MPKPTESKTVQDRILTYAQEMTPQWRYVSRSEAETRRGFNNIDNNDIQVQAQQASLYFDDLLYQKIQQFNPTYNETQQELITKLNSLPTDIYGNRDFLNYLRNQVKYFCPVEKRELDLTLINYEDPTQNEYEVTEEYYTHNRKDGIREDIVFLINGIPILVIECKNADKIEGIALGIDQIRRYHREAPELFVPQMLFTATEAIGFSYGVTWNLVRRNIFNWKDEQIGQLENKIKTFCHPYILLKFLLNYIIFAEKDETLQKFILKQHQTIAIEKVIQRCHDTEKSRGLVWHTQGSGKTFTMIKIAEMLFKAPDSEKPTIILIIDRNELQDQLLRNLNNLGVNNIRHANRIKTLIELLENDYRGIIITMIHKFREMPTDVNLRNNIYVLIDEAHRTTGGDLGTYLMAGLPHATIIGFTGTPIDKTNQGKGTFKTFGTDDEKGYLHKYSIAESIEDGTTLPLYYNLAPNEMLVPAEIMDQEFLDLVETEGINDIAELNKILDRAVNLKNFLKGDQRVDQVAKYVAQHYTKNVEPLGYKAFLVAVDRPACAKYKQALDRYLPLEYSAVVYTGNNNDTEDLKTHHIDDKTEKQIRKNFAKFGEYPKILIVTEKLLTGYDAPILYAMYLDKPMRDHTLLQAIARVNRPYENETEEMVKPHGFVLDFVGIFDKLEKALSFDSQEVNAIVKDLSLLKNLFKIKIEQLIKNYLTLIQHNFNDQDVDHLLEYFRDKERRKAFTKDYKSLEMLYEVISPDAFLRPYLNEYGTLSGIYQVIRNAYSKRVYVDREVKRKTDQIVQNNIATTAIPTVTDFIEINAQTIETIQNKGGGKTTKVINLIKSIEKTAEENNDDPFLIAMVQRAKAIQEQFENRQTDTQETLDLLLQAVRENEQRKQEQSAKGFDSLSFFVYQALENAGIDNPEDMAQEIRQHFIENPNWKTSEGELRELRKNVTFSIYTEIDELEKVTALVEQLFTLLQQNH